MRHEAGIVNTSLGIYVRKGACHSEQMKVELRFDMRANSRGYISVNSDEVVTRGCDWRSAYD